MQAAVCSLASVASCTSPSVAAQHAPQNAMEHICEIARFHDRCSGLMLELLHALAATPNQPRTFPEVEDSIGWPHRRIASVLGGVSPTSVTPSSAAVGPTASRTTAARPLVDGRSDGRQAGACRAGGVTDVTDAASRALGERVRAN